MHKLGLIVIPGVDQWPYPLRALLFALCGVLFALLFASSDVFRSVDFDLMDTHGRMFATDMKFDDVVAIDVDEETIAQLQPKWGPWPYDRAVYAQAVQWLQKSGVRAIGFDILFAEGRSGDDAFAAAIDERVVLAAAALPYGFERDSTYRTQLTRKTWGGAPSEGVYPLTDLTLPRAQLSTRASLGVISVPVDGDGIVRRVPLVFSVYGRLAPSLGLALMQAGHGVPEIASNDGILSLGNRSWPVSPRAEAVLRFPSNLGGLRTVPFYHVVQAVAGEPALVPLGESLRGKIVLIGSSSAALGDYVQTPVGRQPGVKMQAMITQMLLSGQTLKPRAWAWEAALSASALLLILLLGHPRLQRYAALQWSAIPLVIVFIGIFAGAAISYTQSIGLLFAIVATVLTHLISVLYQQLQLYRHNQRLETEKRAALRADELKSQFLSHITHELRTPLTAIMGFNNINWHDSTLGRDHRMKNSEIVDRNCQHMLSLVNNLLDQAKLNAGQLSIQRHPDKLRTVVSDAIATVEPLLSGKPVRLRIDEVDVPEYLDIDAFRLRQILLNLLSNAIKFTDKGLISVVSAWHEGELTISVIDTGAGMPEQALQRLFTAFQQADDSVAARHGGTGLGLTISRTLARLMGGDIKVHSAVGQGTVFTVTVAAPLAEAESTAQLEQTVAETGVNPILQGTVLLAEDMPDTRALLTRYLERFGLTVLQAENGEQAIEIALSQRPDVVLMDLEMPAVAGTEATRSLRMCGFSAPVLAITAYKREEDRQRALAAGCNDVIVKPVTRATLLAALSTALAPSASLRRDA